jgi:hypothetical protein
MIYIGIDPDIEKSGIACWDSESKSFDYIKNMSFWEIIEEFELWNIDINVVIEAGWLIKKSNWHGRAYQSKSVGERIAKNVGSNHQVGILLAEYCEKNNIKYELVKPKGKINSESFKEITKYTKRTNQDQRDAAMLVFGF